MIPRQIDLAARQQKAPVDQLRNSIRQIARKVRPVIRSAILAQPARHKNLGIAVSQRQLHIRIGLVVAQQDVKARLPLFDQIVLERQCLVLVVDEDVVHIDGLAHQRSRLGVRLRSLQQIRAHPRPQILRLADVDHLIVGVLV